MRTGISSTNAQKIRDSKAVEETQNRAISDAGCGEDVSVKSNVLGVRRCPQCGRFDFRAYRLRRRSRRLRQIRLRQGNPARAFRHSYRQSALRRRRLQAASRRRLLKPLGIAAFCRARSSIKTADPPAPRETSSSSDSKFARASASAVRRSARIMPRSSHRMLTSKKIARPSFQKMSEAERSEELDLMFLEFARAIEREKLRCSRSMR